jgi:phenylacetate-CoA ligase
MRHYRQRIAVGSSREELLALQRRRLLETVRHAARASPLYRELYADVELADDLDVAALPVVTKPMLMERFDEWVSDSRLRLGEVEAHLGRVRGDELYLGEYRCLVTGGSTGHRGVFVYGRREWRQVLAMWLRWAELAGQAPRPGRRLRIGSVGAASPLHVTARGGICLDLGVQRMCRLDARAPLAEIVAALDAHRPEYLIGYPSMVSLLAIEQLEGRLRIAPWTVVTGSEVRSEEMAANIREAWGVQPFDQYGTTEGLYGSDCDRHRGIHLFEDLCLVEVVDAHNRPVPEGVVGAKLLITNFTRRTQPLVRYELSDMVALSSEPCACGLPLARIVSLQGRSDDILRLDGAGGTSVAVHPHTLKSAMAAQAQLRQYKIVQDGHGLRVLAALRDGVHAEDAVTRIEASLRSALLAAGAADVPLDVTIVAELPPAEGIAGKFKVIESRVDSPTDLGR